MARRGRRRLVTPVHPQGPGVGVGADGAAGGKPRQARDGGRHEGDRAPAGTVWCGALGAFSSPVVGKQQYARRLGCRRRRRFLHC